MLKRYDQEKTTPISAFKHAPINQETPERIAYNILLLRLADEKLVKAYSNYLNDCYYKEVVRTV